MLPQDFDIDVLRTFVAICESRSFTKAAERVRRTPSAISLQVKKLEAQVGRALFEREPRAVVPTVDGEALLFDARRLIEMNDAVLARFLVPRVEGIVRFGAPNDSGVLALPRFLRRFAATHPHVEVDVILDASCALRDGCATGDLDLVLFSLDDGPHEEIVFTEDLVWIGCRDGAAAACRPLPLALAKAGCSWRARALDALGRAAIPYRTAYSSDHSQGQIAAVEADLAVAALPLSVAGGSLMRVPAAAGLPALPRYDVRMRLRDGCGPAALALAAHVRESFSEQAARGARLLA